MRKEFKDYKKYIKFILIGTKGNDKTISQKILRPQDSFENFLSTFGNSHENTGEITQVQNKNKYWKISWKYFRKVYQR